MHPRPIDAIIEKRLVRRNQVLERYLALLADRTRTIDRDETDRLEHSLLIERDLISELTSLTRVLRTIGSRVAPPLRGSCRSRLETTGTLLLSRVRELHAGNRALLSSRIGETGRRLDALHLPRRARSVFRSEKYGGSMIDIEL